MGETTQYKCRVTDRLWKWARQPRWDLNRWEATLWSFQSCCCCCAVLHPCCSLKGEMWSWRAASTHQDLAAETANPANWDLLDSTVTVSLWTLEGKHCIYFDAVSVLVTEWTLSTLWYSENTRMISKKNWDWEIDQPFSAFKGDKGVSAGQKPPWAARVNKKGQTGCPAGEILTMLCVWIWPVVFVQYVSHLLIKTCPKRKSMFSITFKVP